MAQQAPPIQNFEAHAEALNHQFRQDPEEFRKAADWVVKFASYFPEHLYGESPTLSQTEVAGQAIFNGLGRLLDDDARQSFLQVAYDELEEAEFKADPNDRDAISRPTTLIEVLQSNFPDEMRQVMGEPAEADQKGRLTVITHKSMKAEIVELLRQESGLEAIKFDFTDLSEEGLREGADAVINAAKALRVALTQTDKNHSTLRAGTMVGGHKFVEFEHTQKAGRRIDGIKKLRADSKPDGAVVFLRQESHRTTTGINRRHTEISANNESTIDGTYTLFIPVPQTEKEKDGKQAESRVEYKPSVDQIKDPAQLGFMSKAILVELTREIDRRIAVYATGQTSVSEAVEAVRAGQR